MKHFSSLLSKIQDARYFPAEIHGIQTSSALALQLFELLKHRKDRVLVVLPTAQQLSDLSNDLSSLGCTEHIGLKKTDLSPYNSIFPSESDISNRIGFLSAKAYGTKKLFLASYQDLLSYTAPESFFLENKIHLRVGEELPKQFFLKLDQLGYRSVQTVEDPLCFSDRGGIVDIFPAHESQAYRIELFDTEIESIRLFDVEDQRSTEKRDDILLGPARECLYEKTDLEVLIKSWKESLQSSGVDPSSKQEYISQITRRKNFLGMDYLIRFFHPNASLVFEHFKEDLCLFIEPSLAIAEFDQFLAKLGKEYQDCPEEEIKPRPEDLYSKNSLTEMAEKPVYIHALHIEGELKPRPVQSFEYRVLKHESLLSTPSTGKPRAIDRLQALNHQGFHCIIGLPSQTQRERASLILNNHQIEFLSVESLAEAVNKIQVESKKETKRKVILAAQGLKESFKIELESLALWNESDFFGKKDLQRRSGKKQLMDSGASFHFAELDTGDRIVHVQHGVGVFQGLVSMEIQGVKSEFVHMSYKGGDKLYIPVYKIGLLQKYSGSLDVDRLGGKSWEKAKLKVKAAIKDIADELLRLYAKRKQITRPPFSVDATEFDRFEEEFPYVETEDQLDAIKDILGDFTNDQPMDRLVCGDVGFGKTEVAMRAAFLALSHGKQVVVLVPTTVLAFQHFENFKKRFKDWPFQIDSLSRFTSTKDSKRIIEDVKLGRTDILIGTHRVLSSDVNLTKLGLIIIDEEHRFGVVHKEKLKQWKTSVDCLSLSATPIPRTLNMSLVGIRDLSIINTPPLDRLPVRTYVHRYSESSIFSAIELELKRDGQVYFIHNKVKSIQARAHEIRELFPQARLAVAHGQMKESELEKIMLQFFSRKIDILLCTAIVENGVDNPFANTMIIDNAHQMGLSQLYQFRGRVGRGKERAYCHLLVPQNIKLEKDAQERLRIIQEHTALGSGLKIAHHDLELRGAGSILGSEQSGEVNVVGYDLYLELLEQSLSEAKGEDPGKEELEPEINLRIPALIPDRYIPDIRTRLNYYKAMSEIRSEDDLAKVEDELIDQFGKMPEEVINLMGIMLIRRYCKLLGIREINAGSTNLSFSFSLSTKINVAHLIQLGVREPTKYKITPDNRLMIKQNLGSWAQVLEEVKHLEALLL